jgi:hypothetical protein
MGEETEAPEHQLEGRFFAVGKSPIVSGTEIS